MMYTISSTLLSGHDNLAKYGTVDRDDDSSRTSEAGRSGCSLGWHG